MIGRLILQAINARGVNFIYAREFLKTTYGEAGWPKLLAQLSDPARVVWESMIMPISSHPFAYFKEMIDVTCGHFHAGRNEHIWQMYEFIADRSLNQLYKVFFRLSKPSFVIGNYPRLWEKFFTAGEVSVPSAGRGSAELNFVLPGIFLDWLPPACRGFSNKAITMAGGKNLAQQEVSQTKVAEDSYAIIFVLSWDE
jgi:hypothetical protein